MQNILDRISYVVLFVTDQDKALDFYINKLGFELRGDNPVPHVSSLWALGISHCKLFYGPGNKGVSAPAPDYLPGAIFIESSDVEVAFTALRAWGVQFEETRPAHLPYGIYVTVLDPDGNRITIHSN